LFLRIGIVCHINHLPIAAFVIISRGGLEKNRLLETLLSLLLLLLLLGDETCRDRTDGGNNVVETKSRRAICCARVLVDVMTNASDHPAMSKAVPIVGDNEMLFMFFVPFSFHSWATP
jgi:hypothetical protein